MVGMAVAVALKAKKETKKQVAMLMYAIISWVNGRC